MDLFGRQYFLPKSGIFLSFCVALIFYGFFEWPSNQKNCQTEQHLMATSRAVANFSSAFLVVYVTVPSTEIGKRIAHELVRRRLAACVNILPQLTSVYEWKGTVEEQNESMLIIKTGRERLAQLKEAVDKLHPYDVPEFVALPIEYGSEPYLRWISDQISGGEGQAAEKEETTKKLEKESNKEEAKP